MKVQDIMTSNPAVCEPSDDLAAVANRMWGNDCGILPVVENGRLRGVITDRDICMGLTFKGAPPAAVTVADVIKGHILYGCSPEMEVRDALKIMRNHYVRRLPVEDDGKIVGMLSMNDIVLVAQEGKGEAPSYAEVIDAMQGICSHHAVALAA